jgi:tRNA (mo5U34)-methyltransferase
MSRLLFDEPYYLAINEARWRVAERVVVALRVQASLTTCLDVGSGPGWFSERLVGLGLRVTGIDGRHELAEEARRRVPGAAFQAVDAESEPAMAALGRFDLVFCFGLLYHTENPFRVLRNLERATGSVLLLETQVLPGDEPILRLIGEGHNETQGLTYHSLVASRSALVRMLDTAGYTWVGRYTGTIDHPDFLDTPERHPRRAVYLAARRPFDAPDVETEPRVVVGKYDYRKR